MTRFGSRYTRDVAGAFDNAGSFLNGAAAFEDAADFSGPTDADSSNIETAMRLRMMAAAKSGKLGEKAAIERALLTNKARRQMAAHNLKYGSQAGVPESERRLNARIEAWNNPQQNARRIDVMRRGLMQDQTVSQDALAKAQVERLEQRFEEMPIVDLGPLRFTQGAQVAAIFQSLNGLDEETVVDAARAIQVARAQANRVAKNRRKIVQKELINKARTRGQNPSYFIQRYGKSYSPLDGLDAIQTINENTVAMPVGEFQQLLLDNGADPYRIISSKTGKPDGIGGETTSKRAQEIGKKLGFGVIKLEYYDNMRSVRVSPSKFVAQMQGSPATSPSDKVKSVKVNTKTLQETLLKLGSPSAGLVGKNGKPDGVFGSGTAKALADQAKANNLPLSTAKRSGSSAIIAPDTTWTSLKKVAGSRPKDVGTAPQEVPAKDVQSVLLLLGAPKTGIVGKDGKPDGIAGSRTKAAFLEQAKRFGLPVKNLGTKSSGKIVTIEPATTWHELAKHGSKVMEAPQPAPTTPGDQPRTYSTNQPVKSVQQWLLNLGAPRSGIISSQTGQPDGKWGPKSEAALKKIAGSMGFNSVLVKKAITSAGNAIAISPPEVVSALIEGTSGRMTTGVETSKETQLVEAKKEAAVAPTRKEMAKDVVDSINAYIKKHKKAPKESFSRVKQYQKLAGFSGKNLDGKWGPATRSAVAQDLNVAENSLPASAFDKKVVAAPKTVSLKDRAEKARNAVLNFIERKGKPPAIVVAEVSDFQRAVIGDKKFDSKYRKSIKRADGKYGPDTRGAMADALGVDQRELPITAFDKGAPKTQPTREDKIEEQVEIKKAQVHANEDKANGAAVVTDTSAVTPVSPTESTTITTTQSDSEEPMPQDDEVPWYKQPKYLIGGGIALALGFGVMSGMRKRSAGLPARV